VLNQINLTNVNIQSVGGITLDPASTGASRTFYLADRGLDPNPTRVPTCPTPTPPGCEAFNDGVIHVVQVNMPTIGNRPPLSDAGEDEIADTLETVTLLGSGEDGESPSSPAPLTYAWTRVSGPGTVTLGTPNAPTTTASFSAAGDQVMRLTVSDGSLTDFDDTVVHVFAPAAPRSVNIPIRSGEDDGLESIGTTSNGFTDLESADNELGNTNGTDANKVMTGLRFTKLPVPKGSTIDDARIQFSVDEANSSAASYVVRGQLAGNAPPFLHGNSVATGSKFNISSRTPTAASVAWNNVPAWTTIREEGPNQRTPQLASILQEIVSQPTWARGNALVLTIQNAAGNTGRRTAEAKDGRIPPYLTLTFRSPLPNVAPIVNAGADASVNVVGSASLDGTVTDDGKPGPTVTTTWSKFSGPGSVTFANPAAQDTTATFSAPGTYTLRLTANDSALSAFDDVVITVQQAPKAPQVSAGSDLTVTLPAAATLDGTVTDDGPVQTTWSKVSGPGTVTFANPALVDTTAAFSQPGSYTLRLTGNDGTLNASDDVVVTVGDTATPPPSGAPHVSGGLTRSSVAVGEITRFKGTVSPAVQGESVLLQRLKGKHWVTVATKQLPAGSTAAYSFNIDPKASGRYRYRTFVPSYAGVPAATLDGPAHGVKLSVYKAKITGVHQAGDEFVKLVNTGTVKINLHGWLLENRGTGVQRTLPKFLVPGGHFVRIHSGEGVSDRNDLYLGRSDMWGTHATAVLRNERSVQLDRWNY
jgi:hypothetical protein